VERHPEDLAAKQVDRPPGASAVLDGPSDDPLYEGRRRRVTEGPFGPVVDDRP